MLRTRSMEADQTPAGDRDGAGIPTAQIWGSFEAAIIAPIDASSKENSRQQVSPQLREASGLVDMWSGLSSLLPDRHRRQARKPVPQKTEDLRQRATVGLPRVSCSPTPGSSVNNSILLS